MKSTHPGESAGRGFAQGGKWDDEEPGPLLALAVTAVAESDLSGVNEDELLGLASAARKVAALMAWAEARAEAEFAARNMAWDPRAGQEVLDDSAVQELAQEIHLSAGSARGQMDRSLWARAGLGSCLALHRAGKISEYGMRIIAEMTMQVDPVLIGRVDRMVADQAADRTPLSLRRLVQKVIMLVDPVAADRKQKAAKKTRRVEIGQEYSGNGMVAAREIAVADTLAIKQTLTKWAKAMRQAGVKGTLDNLRADALTALVLERHPVTKGVRPAGTGAACGGSNGPWGDLRPGDQDPAEQAEDEDAAFYDPFSFRDGDSRDESGSDDDGGEDSGAVAGEPAAVINILMPAGTMAGLSGAPAEIAGLGYVGAADAREMIAAASRNPVTRWCVTEVGRDGTAVAHGCARGQHQWTPPDRAGPPSTGPPGIGGFLASLGITLEPVAREGCDHRHCEPQHDPSRRLSHLIRARSATCETSGCGAAAMTADLDHTEPYENGGPTCECNLGPRCRHHHRTKQHPRWQVDQVRPGLTVWTGPSGRSRVVRPTRYLL